MYEIQYMDFNVIRFMVAWNTKLSNKSTIHFTNSGTRYMWLESVHESMFCRPDIINNDLS